MKDDALKPAPLDVWSRRFLEEVAKGDVAFVTPDGHVLSWRHYRFTYPRYRDVAEEWQPPSQSLDALVLHFGAYEVSFPVVTLAKNSLGIVYRDQHEQLTKWWYTTHHCSPNALPMEAQILIERWAGASSKFEVIVAIQAVERENLQPFLQEPGVRLGRSVARLSEVARRLINEDPPADIVSNAASNLRDHYEARKKKRADIASRTGGPNDGAHATKTVDENGLRAQRDLLRHGARSWGIHGVSRLEELATALPPEYWTDPLIYPWALFVDAIRRRTSTLDLLRLARVLVDLNNLRQGTSATDFDYLPWADTAAYLGQYRTAWCLAVRAMDGMWRRGAEHRNTYGGKDFAPADRALNIKLLADLAARAGHSYWASMFALWNADFETAIKVQEWAEKPESIQAMAKAREEWAAQEEEKARPEPIPPIEKDRQALASKKRPLVSRVLTARRLIRERSTSASI